MDKFSSAFGKCHSTMVCLLSVRIFNYVTFIWNICFLCFSSMPVNKLSLVLVYYIFYITFEYNVTECTCVRNQSIPQWSWTCHKLIWKSKVKQIIQNNVASILGNLTPSMEYRLENNEFMLRNKNTLLKQNWDNYLKIIYQRCSCSTNLTIKEVKNT